MQAASWELSGTGKLFDGAIFPLSESHGLLSYRTAGIAKICHLE